MSTNRLISIGAGILAVCFAALAFHYYTAYVAVSNLSVSPENSNENIFQVASSTGEVFFTVTANGKVGVGTAVPQAALEVRGLARIYTSSSTPCTKEIEGAIAYDPLREHFFGCNSAEWRRLDN